jgi:hypothetical protein
VQNVPLKHPEGHTAISPLDQIVHNQLRFREMNSMQTYTGRLKSPGFKFLLEGKEQLTSARGSSGVRISPSCISYGKVLPFPISSEPGLTGGYLMYRSKSRPSNQTLQVLYSTQCRVCVPIDDVVYCRIFHSSYFPFLLWNNQHSNRLVLIKSSPQPRLSSF